MRMATAGMAASAILLSGCAPHIAGSGKPPATLSESQNYYDTQTVVGPCTSAAESAILASIASAVIAQGMNRIGDAIKAAADSETRTVLARRNVEFRKGKPIGPCVTIARGWFHRGALDYGKSAFIANPDSQWPYAERAEVASFWRAGLALAATPDFFFQGRIATATDGSAYTIVPLAASLDEPISSTPLRPSGTRSVLLSFAFSEVGKSADLQKGGGTTITLGKMVPGEYTEYSGAACVAGVAANQATPLTDCTKTEAYDMIVHSPMESEWFSVPLTDKGKPMMLQALVAETRSASQFLAFVSDVFGATKAAATTELQQALIPSVGDAAAETELSAREKADNDADTALAKAIVDLKGCVAAPADPAKRLAARSSLRSYLQAARKAERTVDADGAAAAISTGGSDAGACQAGLDKIMAS